MFFALAVACVGACGCESLRGPGFDDGGMTRNLRHVTESAGAPWGASTKAREIENNLGYTGP